MMSKKAVNGSYFLRLNGEKEWSVSERIIVLIWRCLKLPISTCKSRTSCGNNNSILMKLKWACNLQCYNNYQLAFFFYLAIAICNTKNKSKFFSSHILAARGSYFECGLVRWRPFFLHIKTSIAVIFMCAYLWVY